MTSKNFDNLRVAAFESRRRDDMARLIERHGGRPSVSPSMREAPAEDTSAIVDFAHQLITGQVDVVIFMTGVGFQHMLAAVERRLDRQRYLDCLKDITTIVRGPKPVAAMKEVGLKPKLRAPEPNTWREVISTIDANMSIANQTVVLQEYGKANASLVAGLEARGARVRCVRPYAWELPEDVEPLMDNVRSIAAGEQNVVMFTSAHQIVNMLKAAEMLDLEDELRGALKKMIVCSIGPTTSEMLRECELPVDLEPEHPKMGQLVAAAAEQSGELLGRKRRVSVMLEQASAAPDNSAPWQNSPFMKACRREPTDVTPIWLMRQAGRYMAEYREVRAKTTFLELCKNPQLCSEVMVTAVEKLGVDAAIIFSDLLPILEPMGLDLEFAKGEGPVIHNPVREPGDVRRVVELESVESLDFVMQTVRQTRADLPDHLPLIGFAGAPFTLASYTIEGGASRNYLFTKTLMYRDEGAWRALMERFARAVSIYLNAQIVAGASCVQLFDSWAGCLGVQDYRRYVLPYLRQIFDSLPPHVPAINFATGNPALLPSLAEAGGHVIGVDWRVPLDQAWDVVGYDRAVQGNLDPAVLLSSVDDIRHRAEQVLELAGRRAGHIFNLGHGVLQQTPVDNAKALVDAVHELSSR